MTETVTIDRPPVAKPVSRPRSTKPATVSASALALHLDCSRTYIGKLEAEGVIQRQGDGFPLDQSRVAYLRYLRRERRQSPRVRLTLITSRSRLRCCDCARFAGIWTNWTSVRKMKEGETPQTTYSRFSRLSRTWRSALSIRRQCQ